MYICVCQLPTQMKQELWATDLDVSYHDMVAMSSMTEFATNGQMESITHSFVIPPPVKQVEQKTRRYVQPQPEVCHPFFSPFSCSLLYGYDFKHVNQPWF
jgi:hypothetical protein